MNPQERPTAAFDLAIVGMGIVIGRHLSVEAREIMRLCTTIFVLDNAYGPDPEVMALDVPIVDLNEFYAEGQRRREIYRRMAAEILTSAVVKPPVAFASYGHPQVYCYPTTLLRKAGPILGLRTTIVPGVSTLDALLVDIDFDLGAQGLQTYDASDALARQRQLQPDVPCVLWQVTWIGEATYRSGPAGVDGFRELQRYLLRFYPAEHEVLSVFSSPHPALDSITERHRLENLSDALAGGVQSGTLFIPPLTSKPRYPRDTE